MTEFFIQKDKLAEELGRAMGAIERKSTIPILENVLIKPSAANIELLTTNLDLGFHITANVDQIVGTESFCTPCRKFYDIVKSMPEGVIKIWTDEQGYVKISAKGSHFRIPGNNATQFPQLAQPPAEDEWLTVPAKVFSTMLRGVEFAQSPEEDKRYSISGIKIEVNSEGIRMVSTDGHRLALAETPLNELLLNDLDLLLPKRAVTELLRFITESDKYISLAICPNEMFFRIDNRTFYSRLLVGQFPQYQALLNQTHPYLTTVDPEIFIPSVKRAMLVAGEKLASIYLHFKEKKVHIQARTAEDGECNEILDSDFNGPEMKIPLSGRYLLDFLEQAKSKVRIEIKNPSTQLFLKTDREEIKQQYTLMTLRDK